MRTERESSNSPGFEALVGRLYISSEYFQYFLEMPDQYLNSLADAGFPLTDREVECLRFALEKYRIRSRINANTSTEIRQREWAILFAPVLECLRRPSRED